MPDVEPGESIIDALADVDDLSTSIATRLDDAGFETVGDVARAKPDDLRDVPYVGAAKVGLLEEFVADVVIEDEGGPRTVDWSGLESVVSEATIPLSVRYGDRVLIGGHSWNRYHTRDCCVVRSRDADLDPVTVETAERRGNTPCQACHDPAVHDEGGGPQCGSDLEDLEDAREVILEATLGEKLRVTMARQEGFTQAFAVIATEPAVEWETATGDSWQTRRLRISQSMSGREDGRECDLVLGPDGIWLEGYPSQPVHGARRRPAWAVEFVGAVGRVSQASYYQLLGQQQEESEARPEGDDSWQKYSSRGEA